MHALCNILFLLFLYNIILFSKRRGPHIYKRVLISCENGDPGSPFPHDTGIKPSPVTVAGSSFIICYDSSLLEALKRAPECIFNAFQ